MAESYVFISLRFLFFLFCFFVSFLPFALPSFSWDRLLILFYLWLVIVESGFSRFSASDQVAILARQAFGRGRMSEGFSRDVVELTRFTPCDAVTTHLAMDM